MNNNLVIFGFGYSAEAIATKSAQRFSRVNGTTRTTEKMPGMSTFNVEPIQFSSIVTDEKLHTCLDQATHIIISIAPDAAGDPVLNALQGKLENCKNLQWIGYLSTVGVYGNHDGQWVNEETQCRPVSKRSRQRVAAEKAWQEFAQERAIPLAVFRLSGIYGPGRNTFINIEKGEARRLVKPGQVFNRIHREDIANAVDLAMALNASGIFNITDDLPAPPQDVVTFACELAGVTPPPETDFESAELTPMARSFYGENKRVSNAKSKLILGLEYQWPDYRSALTRMWNEKSWRPLRK
jgi:nucleoside-diphosphate-sugar epimerase